MINSVRSYVCVRGYNTLSTFLASMDQEKKTELMTNFIAGLDKGSNDDLEDAVDVADAFGSIKDSTLATFLRAKVKENYEQAFNTRSRERHGALRTDGCDI